MKIIFKDCRHWRVKNFCNKYKKDIDNCKGKCFIKKKSYRFYKGKWTEASMSWLEEADHGL